MMDAIQTTPLLEATAPRARKLRDVHRGDRVFRRLVGFFAVALVLVLMAIAGNLLRLSLPAWQKFGLGFLFSQEWNPVSETFGAAAFIWGTVVSSGLALLMAVPVAIGVALLLGEVLPAWLSRLLGFLVEMLAAIPSVVYGLWGVFVLAPFMRETVQPPLADYFGFLPLFRGAPYGVGMLTAGVILAIMITPTVTAICREVFRAIPDGSREAALALGATRWEMMRVSVLSSARSGILTAVIMGLGRAFGETMAVTMVIGNRSEIDFSLLAPAQTMASVIANEYAEAEGDMHLASLAAVGLALFVVSLVVNSGARFLLWRIQGKSGRTV